MLASSLLERHRAARKDAPEGFSAEALSALVHCDWPGNVRELENAVERAVAVSDGSRIGVEALPDEVTAAAMTDLGLGRVTSLSYHEVLTLARDRVSREYLVALLREFAGNVTKSAERAGVKRESLHRLIKRYGIRSDDFKP